MATMSVAAYCTLKGCTPSEIRNARVRLLKNTKGDEYPALVVENGDKAIFLTTSKKYNFTTVDQMVNFISEHGGKDLCVAYGYDTQTHQDCACLCLKGEDNAPVINLSAF
jgi:hypothetical protein